jgi:ABC-2 type transport system permease protein
MSATSPETAARASVLGRLTSTELKLLARERVRLILGTALPLLLLVIFGSVALYKKPQKFLGGHTLLGYYVPVLIVFSLAMLALIMMPMVLAGYRERGILRRLQTTPAGPARLLAAQLGANLVVAVVRAALILAVARLGYDVALPRQAAGFVVATLLTIAALLAIGLFIAAVGPTAQAAQAMGMILLYPLMFFAGLFFPVPALPSFVQHVSHATPLGAAVQALTDAAQGQWPHAQPLLILAAYAVAFGLAAARLFRWE